MAITRIVGPNGEPLENVFASSISPDGDTLLLQRGSSFDAAIYDVNSGGFTLLPNAVEGQQSPQFNYEGLSSGNLLLLQAEFDIPNPSFFDPELAVVESDGTVVRVLDPPAGSRYFTPQFLGEDQVAVRVVPVGNAEAPPFDVEVIDLATGAATGIDVGDGGDRGLDLIDASADGGVLLISPDYSAEKPRFLIYDAAAEQVREVPVDLPNLIDTLQLTLDGAGLLAIEAGASNMVKLFDLTTGALRFEAELPEKTSGGSLAIDSTGRFVAAGSQDSGVEGGGRQVLSVFDLDDGGEISIELGPLFPDARLVRNPSPVAVREVDGAPVVTLELDVVGGRRLFDVGLDVLAVPDQATTGGATVAIDALANDVDFGDDGLRLVAAGPAGNGVTSIDDRGTTDPADDRLLYTPDAGFAGTDHFAYTVRDGGGAVDEGEVLVLVTAPDPEGFTVTTAKDTVVDDGELSLREAVLRANANPGADTITFADGLRGATIALQGREAGVDEGLVVTDDLTIDGDTLDGGTGGITIGDPTEPYRDVGGGYEYDSGVQVLRVEGARLGLEDLTITGGDTGVYAADATLTATRSGFEDIGAFGSATGIGARSSTVTLTDSFISGLNGYYEPNEFAISARDSDIALLRSQITGNDSYNGVTIGVSGSLRVEESLIADNDVGRYGSLVTVQGDLTIVNSTIANNFVDNDGGFGLNSGVELLAGGTGTITNSTIAGNKFDIFEVDGSSRTFALFVEPGADLTLENSIVLGNGSRSNPSEIRDVGGAIVSNGRNVFSQETVEGTVATDTTGSTIEDVFARINPNGAGYGPQPDLADNGGPTETLALLQSPTNPAIDAAVAADAPPVDQRGFARDDAPDVGAFEAGADGGPGIPVLPPLPELAEKVPVDPARINGVPLELLAPSVDVTEPQTIAVFPLSAEAEQANALGYVVYDEDDRIVAIKMLFDDIDAFIADAFVGNKAFTFPIEEGQRFNPFVVADGADLNPAGLLDRDNDFVLLDRDGNLAGIADRRPQLFAQDDDGGLTRVEGELIFAADPKPGTPGVDPNPQGGVRALSGYGEERNDLLIAFEDKPFDPDNDFNDLVLEVDIPGFRGVPSDDAMV